MIAARILGPASKLAIARGLHSDTLHSSLGESLVLDSADETEFYSAMDWLLARQPRIERELAKRELQDGAMVLYDLTSTYFEGRHCPLAKPGHSRNDKSGTPPIPKPWPLRSTSFATASVFRRSFSLEIVA